MNKESKEKDPNYYPDGALNRFMDALELGKSMEEARLAAGISQDMLCKWLEMDDWCFDMLLEDALATGRTTKKVSEGPRMKWKYANLFGKDSDPELQWAAIMADLADWFDCHDPAAWTRMPGERKKRFRDAQRLMRAIEEQRRHEQGN